ncbi:MAG: DUF4296 domain-containing protein [Sphingomonadales bacterium]|nr:DUF4296 domain-containing protein [Sphingomonadales bacterium]
MLLRKITIACLFVVAACAKKAPIAKEKMVEVMTDVMLMESANAINYNHGLLPDSLWENDYTVVFKKNNISKEEFKNAISYYQEHPDVFSGIMEKVITRLQKMQLKRQTERP